ncbi:MAG: MBL fold metallo-hydrolase [Clostridia bacterium]|nr:MBL fold metallo-hydrolase [Clostridia bacterium]
MQTEKIINIGKNSDNSYLILDEKNVVVDCTAAKNAENHMSNLKSALGDGRLDYIIITHASPENTGSLAALMREYPSARIVASAAGIKNLTEILNSEFPYDIAKDGAALELGSISLKFFILPNLPWTDTMAVYCAEKKALFCGSIFSARENYYKDVISVYADYAETAAKRLSALDIRKVFSMCGEMISEIGTYIKEYSAERKTEPFAAVFYASHYGYTAEMARIVADAFEKSNMSVCVYDTDRDDFEEMKNALNQCKFFAVGTGTKNRNAYESVWRLVSSVDMVNRKYTPCMVFGSCGWSGEGVYLLERFLKSAGLKVFEKPFLVKFGMNEEDKSKLRETAEKLVSKGEQ